MPAVPDAPLRFNPFYEVLTSIQLCTDLAKMPIEDALVRWPQDESPYAAVTCITVPAQPA